MRWEMNGVVAGKGWFEGELGTVINEAISDSIPYWPVGKVSAEPMLPFYNRPSLSRIEQSRGLQPEWVEKVLSRWMAEMEWTDV